MESDELGLALHARFVAAADKGGGFVSYEWRATAQQPLRVKVRRCDLRVISVSSPCHLPSISPPSPHHLP